VPPDVPPAVRRSASKTIAESCWARPCPRAAVSCSFAVSGSGTLSCRTVRLLASDATRICGQGLGWVWPVLPDRPRPVRHPEVAGPGGWSHFGCYQPLPGREHEHDEHDARHVDW